jgi:1-acyl-sn-glycerol-3-phosphate acyltransferase
MVARSKGRGPWWNAARGIFYPVMWASSPHQFFGVEHVPTEGPALIVANHISYIDPIYTGVFVDTAGRLPRFLAKDSVFRLPVIGKLATTLGQIPVYRGRTNAVDSLHLAGRALDDGHIVVIYPEGTITRDPGFWPMRAHTGAARLVLNHDVPVIPLAHWNTHLIYDHYHGKKYRPFPRKCVTVSAGEPIDTSAFRGQERSSEVLRKLADHLMGAVRDVLAGVRGESSPAAFDQPPQSNSPAQQPPPQGGGSE